MIQSDMKFEIKKCKPGDEEALYAIDAECFFEPWSVISFSDALKKDMYTFLAAVVDGKTVGYIGAYCVIGEVYITNIGVSGKFRKNGIATALMKELIHKCRSEGALYISLEVRVSNCIAISFYEKTGFKLEGKRNNFYENPKEDAYIYTYYFSGEENENTGN